MANQPRSDSPVASTHINGSLPVALLGLLLVASSAQGAEPLRWKFVEGQSFAFRCEQRVGLSLDAGLAGKVEQAIQQTSDVIWTVEEVREDGNARIKQAFRRVKMRVQSGDDPAHEFDTASEDPPLGITAMMAPLLNAVVDHGFIVTMTPNGEVEEIQLPEALRKTIESLSPTAGGAIEEMVKQMARHAVVYLPEAPLGRDQTWDHPTEVVLPMLGKQEVKTTYRYEGQRQERGQPREIITSKTIVIPRDESEQAGVSSKVFSIKATGLVLFDRDQGQIASSRADQEMEIEVRIPLNGVPKIYLGRVEQHSELVRMAPQELANQKLESPQR